MLSENRGCLRPYLSDFEKSEETFLKKMPFIYIITELFEDLFTCGCDTTDSVRYHLRANKVDLSLKKWQPLACAKHFSG
jgi:hypothetical protein